MTEDPIVDEVRRYRTDHAARFGHDMKRIVDALRECERQSGRPLLDPGPKHRLRKTGS